VRFATTRNGSGGSAGSHRSGEGASAGALRFRLLSSVVFLPLFALITRAGGIPFVLFAGAIAILATWETYRLLAGRGLEALLPLGLLSSVVGIALFYFGRLELLFALVVAVFAAGLLSTLVRRGPSAFMRGAGVPFALLYATILPGFLILLRELPRRTGGEYGAGAGGVYLLFLVAWGGDTGAYTVGRIAGRRPLAPSISPKKTVEGALGGLLFATAGAFAARAWLVDGLRASDAAAIGLIGSLLAQAGDLVESLLKREAEVKDASPLIPGHGGVLDRFDSVFLAAPFVYFYLRIVAEGGR